MRFVRFVFTKFSATIIASVSVSGGGHDARSAASSRCGRANNVVAITMAFRIRLAQSAAEQSVEPTSGSAIRYRRASWQFGFGFLFTGLNQPVAACSVKTKHRTRIRIGGPDPVRTFTSVGMLQRGNGIQPSGCRVREATLGKAFQKIPLPRTGLRRVASGAADTTPLG